MEQKYRHLKIVEIKERTKGAWSKKVPLSIGIKGAKHELLLLTDIDCVPVSKDWIKHMVAAGDKTITIGMAPYNVTKSFANFLSRISLEQILKALLSGQSHKISELITRNG